MTSSASSTAKIGFLVPASQGSGLGHYFRTLPYKRRIPESIYISGDDPIKNLDPSAVLLADLNDGEKALRQLEALSLRFLYVDHFFLPESLLKALREQKKFPVAYFDGNFANPAFSCLVNDNPYASPASYPSLAPDRKYFLGPGFHLFRDEIERSKRMVKQKRCFVCFGGTDAGGLTAEAVAGLPTETSYTIVLGPGVPEPMQNIVKKALAGSSLDADLHTNPRDFFPLMAACDRALLSSSTIAYEALYLGLSVSCVQVADNQSLLAGFLLSQRIEVQDARSGKPSFRDLTYRPLSLNFGGESQNLIDYIRGFL